MQNLEKHAVSCADCAFLADCGGLLAPTFDGCFSHCYLSCNPATCDLTCPNNSRLFGSKLEEIGNSFEFSSRGLVTPSLRLEQYIPKIHNGSSRENKLRLSQAVIPYRELVRMSRKAIHSRFRSPREVRGNFRLSDRTACIISCITNDYDIEAMWKGLKYGGLAKDLAKLKPVAVIAPNYSFFVEDVPRTHTMYNRKRIAMAAEMLSKAGCPVILLLSALTRNDWEFWYSLLRENPKMTYIAKAFQTGLYRQQPARQAIEDLSKLQESLGRALHPVALSGGPYQNMLKTHFDRYTIVDSRAFMSAVNRQKLVMTDTGKWVEVPYPTPPGAMIDGLLQENLEARYMRFAG